MSSLATTKKAREYYAPDLRSELHILIVWLHQYCQTTLDGHDRDSQVNELRFQATEFMTDLLRIAPSLTIEEIKTAFRKGVSGEYGPNTKLNVRNYVVWITAALEEKRNTPVYSKPKGLLSAPNEIVDKEAIFNEALEVIKRQYVKTGDFTDMGAAIHDTLVKKGHIQPDSWQTQKKQAESVVYMELQRDRKKAADRFDKSGVKKLDTVMNDLMNDGNPLIIMRCKKMALEQYLKQILQ